MVEFDPLTRACDFYAVVCSCHVSSIKIERKTDKKLS